MLDVSTADELGALDPDAIARVREEAWPQPANAEEVHEALLWMGYVTAEEGEPWTEWLDHFNRHDLTFVYENQRAGQPVNARYRLVHTQDLER